MATHLKSYMSLLIAVCCGGLISQLLMTPTTTTLTTTTNQQEALVYSSREDVNTRPAHRKQQVLLVSYGRSGTTYTSALISHNPEVFYVPEPLFRPWGPQINDSSTALGVIQGYFDCNPLHVDPASYWKNTLILGKSTEPFARCIELKEELNTQEFLACYLNMWNKCIDQRVTYIKTIRTHLEWVAPLMDAYPDLKVLFLIRDPRATFHSQKKNLKVLQGHLLEKGLRRECAKMTEDLHSFRRLSAVFPGRIMGLRYEDGAMEPMINARNIYRFLGFDFNIDAQRFIKQITSSEAKKGKAGREDTGFGYEKADSSKTMNLWRKKVAFSDIDIIDKHCKHLYSKLGYKKTNSEKELRSMNMSLLLTGSFEGLFKPVL